MIERILNITKESYTQELNRSNVLLKKSDYLIKYITSTFVFINALFVFLLNNQLIDTLGLAISYAISGILLCRDLYLAVRVQNLTKVKFFPTGNTILQDIKSNHQKEGKKITPMNLDVDTVNYYSEFTEALENSNNKKAEILNKAYNWYLSTIIIITVIFFIILLSNCITLSITINYKKGGI